MNVPVITWSVIVALFVSIVLFRVLMYLIHTRHAQRPSHQPRHHLVEIGTEREELFMPGDPTGHENYPPYARSSRLEYDDDDI